MLLHRIFSALIGLPLLVYLIYQGNLLLLLGIVIISIKGIDEYYNAFRNLNYAPLKSFGMLLGTSIILSLEGYLPEMDIILIFFLLLGGVFFVFTENKNIIDWLITISGSFYVYYFLATIILIRNLQHGQYLIWIVFLVSWVTDTGAYFIGLNFGKHKLCPKISPKKSIEGAIGGIISAVLAMYIYFYYLGSKMPEFGLEFFIFTGIILSIISQMGDLLASKIKRFCNTKDFGAILPGHGGVLDRFDSIILCAPVLYLILRIFG